MKSKQIGINAWLSASLFVGCVIGFGFVGQIGSDNASLWNSVVVLLTGDFSCSTNEMMFMIEIQSLVVIVFSLIASSFAYFVCLVLRRLLNDHGRKSNNVR